MYYIIYHAYTRRKIPHMPFLASNSPGEVAWGHSESPLAAGRGAGDYRGTHGIFGGFHHGENHGKTMGKPWENIGFHGKTMGTCLKKIGFQWENTKIELVGWKIWCLMISNYHVMMILCLKTRYTTTKPIGLSLFSEIRTTILGVYAFSFETHPYG